MTTVGEEVLRATLHRVAHNFFIGEFSSQLKKRELDHKEQLEKLAEEFPLAITNGEELARLLTFSPRWSKVRACVDFALTRPRVRLGAEIGQTSTHWVFAIEDDGE